VPCGPPWQGDRPVSPRLVGMADNEIRTQTDITDLILDEHGDFRRRFVQLWDLRHSGGTGALAAAWQPLANLLEVHASAEEEIFYPILLKKGSDEAPEETNDAVGDHNEIRDAIRAAARLETGSDAWWQAVLECRNANDAHLAEEERDVIPDFREHSDEALRSSLGAQWVAFHSEHRAARGISGQDIDPEEYIAANS
jgi:Hemerythrin HHE cation binding domain